MLLQFDIIMTVTLLYALIYEQRIVGIGRSWSSLAAAIVTFTKASCSCIAV